MDGQKPEDNYWINRVYYAGNHNIDLDSPLGLVNAFNDYTDELPSPLLSVRTEALPQEGFIDYLLFGKVYPDNSEVQFGTIRAIKGRIELRINIYRNWVNEYFERFKIVMLGLGDEKTKARKKQDFYSRNFFSYVVRTQPENIHNLLENYQLEKLSSPFWKDIEICKINFGTLIDFQLNSPRNPVFGLLGGIRVEPINDIESIVTIYNYDCPMNYQELNFDKETYPLTIKELEILAEHFRQVFRGSIYRVDKDRSHFIPKKAGRPRDLNDLWAIDQLRAGNDEMDVRKNWEERIAPNKVVDIERKWRIVISRSKGKKR